MRIRKIKDRDIVPAVALMKQSGLQIDRDTFVQRLQYFQYKRNHMIVIAEKLGKIVSLMHIGIEPSLTSDRTACVYSLFVDKDKQDSDIAENLLAYGQDWAARHGCENMRYQHMTYALKP